MGHMMLSMNNNEHPASFTREFSCELAADRAADLDLVLRLAHADEATDPLERTASLVRAAVSAHHAGSSLTDAVVSEAQQAVAAMRLDLGCEDWRACSWDGETAVLAELHDALCVVVAARRAARSVRRAG
jgi:hypothetical protein